MPLSSFQRDIASLLATNRSTESHIAGGAFIARQTQSLTSDIDISNNRRALLQEASERDSIALQNAGYAIEWLREFPSIRSATVSKNGENLKLEWAYDSNWRFYPAKMDDDFGYLLHPADFMVNKVLKAASRQSVQDIVDIVHLSSIVPIEAAIIAAPAKDPEFSPSLIVKSISRFARYQQSDFDTLASTSPINGPDTLQALKRGLINTTDLINGIPIDLIGQLYIKNGLFQIPSIQNIKGADVIRASAQGIMANFPNLPVSDLAEIYDRRELEK